MEPLLSWLCLENSLVLQVSLSLFPLQSPYLLKCHTLHAALHHAIERDSELVAVAGVAILTGPGQGFCPILGVVQLPGRCSKGR